MLLTALHQYAKQRHLLDDLPLQMRKLDALVAIGIDGTLRQEYLTPLLQPDTKGKRVSGMKYKLPRFPGDNSGGKAYFLAEGSVAIFGRDKKTGKPIATPGAKKRDDNSTKAFKHFWQQIEAAFAATEDPRLGAILAYKDKYLTQQDGLIQCQVPFLRTRSKDKGKKKGELECIANTGTNASDYVVIEKSTFGFSVDGIPLSLNDDDDPLRDFWFKEYASQASAEEVDNETSTTTEESTANAATLCLVTGEVGNTIARSHTPKILGVPGIQAGRIVSCAKGVPAFSSYGFEMGQNSPVSEIAAASYAVALIDLLRQEESHINLGPVTVCVWAKQSPKIGGQFTRHLAKAFPAEVGRFLKGPFVGNQDLAISRDRLYTVALTGNKARIAVVHWLDQTVGDALEHFQQWWDDLRIVPMFYESISAGETNEAAELQPSPFAIPNLARATLRESKNAKANKLVGDRIVQLYRAAIEGSSPPITLLKPILDEFHSSLVKHDESEFSYWLKQTSRFALLKLILLRFFRNQPQRKEGDFMPTPQLAETSEQAYNLGRLLAVFESLQDRYHNFEKKGADVIDRYYGTASSAPATVFPLLCRLARHHLSKVRKEDESAANRIDNEIGEILKKFEPPKFKRMLTLQEQGIFALGFYQQRAYSRAAGRVLAKLKEARKMRADNKPFNEALNKARELANESEYADLVAAVSEFEAE